MDNRIKDIKEFWEGKAKEQRDSYKASWEDYYCMQLEIETVNNLLEDSDIVLDIGCANGFGTIELASRRPIKIKGIDYAEEMIAAARKVLNQNKDILKGEVSFDIGNILHLNEKENYYNKVITKRVVINLENLENQIKAAKEVHRVLKPEGIFYMSEASADGLKRINALRREFLLDELKEPWHNKYIDENNFIEGISDLFEVIDILNFSSTYYVGSRVLQPFINKLLNKTPNYLSEINNLFKQLPSYGDYGIQKLFILRRI